MKDFENISIILLVISKKMRNFASSNKNNNENMEKFIVIEIKNPTNMVQEFVYPHTIFTDDENKAEEFPTYSKANTFAKRLNKLYGYKRMKALKIAE